MAPMIDHEPPAAGAKPARRLSLVWLPLAAFAILAAVFAFALQTGDPSKLPSALIGKPAPAVTLPPVPELRDKKGNPIPGFSAAQLGQGAPAVLNFWASWCVPCVQEHPFLVQIAERTGVPIHGINYKDQAPAARRFLERYGNPYTTIGQDMNGRSAIEWGVYGMPETFIVDARGIVVFKHVGPITREIMESQVLPIIAKAKGKV